MLLASCANEIKFHKWPSGDFCGSFEIPDGGFYSPNFSWCNDGEFLVTTVPSKGSPIILSVKETRIKTVETVDIMGDIQATAFSRVTQKRIAFGAENGRVLIYDFSNRRKVQELPRLPNGVKYLEYGAHDTSLVAGCRNGEIYLYNSKNSIASTFSVPDANSLTALACHCNMPYMLAATSREGVTVVWDSNTGNAILVHTAHSNIITDVALSISDEVATVGLDQKLIGYDLRSSENIFCCHTEEQLSAVRFMPTGDKIAVATANGKLYCYDKRRMEYPIHTIVAHHTKAIGKIAFQNLVTCANSTSSDTLATQQTESAKSNLTTMIYNSYRHSKHTTVVEEFAGISSQAPSTGATDQELEWQIASSADECLAEYLDSLQVNHNPSIPCQGDVSSNLTIVGTATTPAISSEGIASTAVESSTTTQHVDINIIPGAINILNKFVVTPNNPKGDAMNKRTGTEMGRYFDPGQSDALAKWITKLPDCTEDNVSVEEISELVKLKQELQDAIKRLGEDLTEVIDREFLKVRMAVSRGFVQMEYKMDTRWREFQIMLMKLAVYEEESTREGLDDKGSSKDTEENSVRQQATFSRIPTRNSPNRPS